MKCRSALFFVLFSSAFSFLLPPLVSAEFLLESCRIRPGIEGSVFSAELRFTPELASSVAAPLSSPRRLTIPPEELARGEESDYYWLARAAANAEAPAQRSVTSCLLATPGFYEEDYSGWKISLRAETADGSRALDSRQWAEVRSVRVGTVPARSEEGRVGKECRSRWSQYH